MPDSLADTSSRSRTSEEAASLPEEGNPHLDSAASGSYRYLIPTNPSQDFAGCFRDHSNMPPHKAGQCQVKNERWAILNKATVQGIIDATLRSQMASGASVPSWSGNTSGATQDCAADVVGLDLTVPKSGPDYAAMPGEHASGQNSAYQAGGSAKLPSEFDGYIMGPNEQIAKLSGSSELFSMTRISDSRALPRGTTCPSPSSTSRASACYKTANITVRVHQSRYQMGQLLEHTEPSGPSSECNHGESPPGVETALGQNCCHAHVPSPAKLPSFKNPAYRITTSSPPPPPLSASPSCQAAPTDPIHSHALGAPHCGNGPGNNSERADVDKAAGHGEQARLAHHNIGPKCPGSAGVEKHVKWTDGTVAVPSQKALEADGGQARTKNALVGIKPLVTCRQVTISDVRPTIWSTTVDNAQKNNKMDKNATPELSPDADITGDQSPSANRAGSPREDQTKTVDKVTEFSGCAECNNDTCSNDKPAVLQAGGDCHIMETDCVGGLHDATTEPAKDTLSLASAANGNNNDASAVVPEITPVSCPTPVTYCNTVSATSQAGCELEGITNTDVSRKTVDRCVKPKAAKPVAKSVSKDMDLTVYDTEKDKGNMGDSVTRENASDKLSANSDTTSRNRKGVLSQIGTRSGWVLFNKDLVCSLVDRAILNDDNDSGSEERSIRDDSRIHAKVPFSPHETSRGSQVASTCDNNRAGENPQGDCVKSGNNNMKCDINNCMSPCAKDITISKINESDSQENVNGRHCPIVVDSDVSSNSGNRKRGHGDIDSTDSTPAINRHGTESKVPKMSAASCQPLPAHVPFMMPALALPHQEGATELVHAYNDANSNHLAYVLAASLTKDYLHSLPGGAVMRNIEHALLTQNAVAGLPIIGSDNALLHKLLQSVPPTSATCNKAALSAAGTAADGALDLKTVPLAGRVTTGRRSASPRSQQVSAASEGHPQVGGLPGLDLGVDTPGRRRRLSQSALMADRQSGKLLQSDKSCDTAIALVTPKPAHQAFPQEAFPHNPPTMNFGICQGRGPNSEVLSLIQDNTYQMPPNGGSYSLQRPLHLKECVNQSNIQGSDWSLEQSKNAKGPTGKSESIGSGAFQAGGSLSCKGKVHAVNMSMDGGLRNSTGETRSGRKVSKTTKCKTAKGKDKNNVTGIKAVPSQPTTGLGYSGGGNVGDQRFGPKHGWVALSKAEVHTIVDALTMSLITSEDENNDVPRSSESARAEHVVESPHLPGGNGSPMNDISFSTCNKGPPQSPQHVTFDDKQNVKETAGSHMPNDSNYRSHADAQKVFGEGNVILYDVPSDVKAMVRAVISGNPGQENMGAKMAYCCEQGLESRFGPNDSEQDCKTATEGTAPLEHDASPNVTCPVTMETQDCTGSRDQTGSIGPACDAKVFKWKSSMLKRVQHDEEDPITDVPDSLEKDITSRDVTIPASDHTLSSAASTGKKSRRAMIFAPGKRRQRRVPKVR